MNHAGSGGEYASLAAIATVVVHDSVRATVRDGLVGVSASPQPSAAGTAEGGNAKFTISVPVGSAPSADLRIPWQVLPVGSAIAPYQCAPSGPVGVTASDFEDAETLAGTAVIAAGTNSTEIELTIKDDVAPEVVETYQIALGDPQPGTDDEAAYSVAAAAIGSVAANDPGISVGWRGRSLVPEGDSALYQVCAIPSPANDLTVNWLVRAGAVAPTASAEDFGNANNNAALAAFPSGTATILAGRGSAEVSVPVFEDDLLGDAYRGERRESFDLSLTSVANPSGTVEYGFHPLYGNSTSTGYIREEGRADAGADQVVMTGSLVTLDGNGSYDAGGQYDDEVEEYVWEQVASDGGGALAADGVELSGTGAVRTFTAPAAPATLHFRLTVKDAGNARPSNPDLEELHYDWITITVVREARVENGSFESTGEVTFAPSLRSADSWIFAGHASAVGALANPAQSQFPAAAHGSNVLYLGVDYVGDESTSGRAYQDLGRTRGGKTYTVTAVAAAHSRWEAGYKVSLRDASTDVELASSTSTGSVSIEYTETEARTLRLQIETNGAVTTGSALRTSVDNVVLTASP